MRHLSFPLFQLLLRHSSQQDLAHADQPKKLLIEIHYDAIATRNLSSTLRTDRSEVPPRRDRSKCIVKSQLPSNLVLYER